jgi:hypothetical protein
MLTSESNLSTPRTLLRLLVPLLDSQVISALILLWRLAQRVLSYKTHGGIYEVLDHAVTLHLLDREGRRAVYTKYQQVRFLQDNVIAYQDQAWGDGNIFAEYKCSPGVPVDRYREGNRYRILISLRETKNAGDTETFHIQRTITDGFTRHIEHFQTRVDHQMRKLSISVVFPPARLPRKVTLIEQNATRMTPLGPGHWLTLPDGNVQIMWKTDRPRLFEAYVLRWEW